MIVKLPAQKKSFKSKDTAWKKECTDALDNSLSYHYNEGTRRSVKNKIINQELYEGKLNMRDVTKVLNPTNTRAAYIPSNIQHHPIIVPKIKLLVGEELKRPFDWTVAVGDSEGIGRKQEEKKKLINERITALLEADIKDKEELKAELQQLQIYFKYEWKDMREVRANKLAKHYWKKLELKDVFNKCFEDVVVNGEEIVQFDIVSNDIVVYKLNHSKVYTARTGYSSRIEDADIIVIEDYWSPGKIIDTFYDQLKPKEIDRISEGTVTEDGAFGSAEFANSFRLNEDQFIDGLISYAEASSGSTASGIFVDETGNIRVLRGYWRSQKLVLRVKYFAEDTGEPMYKIMSEDYILDESRGETAERLWVNEWWETTKIGQDIYLRMRPKPVQYSRMSNPSMGHPGIVGEIYNYNQGKSVSLLDRMKSYQYAYDVIWNRLNKAIAKNLGKILEVDLAKVPKGWTIEKWMGFAVDYGIGFVDSAKEITKGAATGKLAGSFNTTGKGIDVETGNYIQQHINLLEYIKTEMSDIGGISPQRQGAISNNETVGGVERSVMQSSNTTEWWFAKHESFKLRAISVMIETAKVALKGNKVKMQNILDDFSSEVFEIDGDEFAEFDYDIFVVNDKSAKEMNQTLTQIAHAYMQNGGNLGIVMDILFSDSMADKRRRIELAESERAQQEQAKTQQAAQMQQEQLAAQMEKEEKDRDLERYKVDANNAAKIIIKEMEQNQDEEELSADIENKKADLLLKIEELRQEMVQHKDKMKIEEKKISKLRKVS